MVKGQSHLNKRDVDSKLETMIKQTVDNMKTVHDIMEKDGDTERALQTLLKADKEIETFITTIMGPKDLEKVAHSRRRRSHGVGYYDPDYKWLVKELDIDQNHHKNLHSLQKEQDLRESLELLNLYQTQSLKFEDSNQPTAYSQAGDLYSPSSEGYHQPSSVTYSQSSDSYSQPSFAYGQSFDEYSQQPYSQSSESEPTVSFNQVAEGYRQQIDAHEPSYSYQQPSTNFVDLEGYPPENSELTPLQKLIENIRPWRKAIPTEVEAAYHGAIEVGKHFGRRIQPIVSSGYNTVAYRYVPQARKTVTKLVNSVPDDIKDFARQGQKIVESRANYATEKAKPSLEKLQQELWVLQAQIKQVAQETGQYANREVVPNIMPALQGLLFDLQETLELAQEIVETDVKPYVQSVHEEVVKPTYSKVGYPQVMVIKVKI